MDEAFFASLETHMAKLDHTKPLTDEDIPKLRKQWYESCKDIMGGAPAELPPLREVNHKIPLIDEGANYRYHLPRCPDSLKPELMAKIKRYTEAGWWEPANVSQAAPLLCIPKKSGKLRTVVDGRK